jgi:hypothetical protein
VIAIPVPLVVIVTLASEAIAWRDNTSAPGAIDAANAVVAVAVKASANNVFLNIGISFNYIKLIFCFIIEA